MQTAHPLISGQLPLGCHPDCKACSHRTMSAAQSLLQKTNFLVQKLQPWAHLIKTISSVDAHERWGYRRKTTLGAEFTRGRWQYGLWRGDELLHIPDCPVHHPDVNHWLSLIVNALPKHDFGLRWLVVSGTLITLVVKNRTNPLVGWPEDKLATQLAEAGLQGLWLHLHPSTGKKIFGKGGLTLLWGKPYARDAMGLLHGPAAFSQLIPSLYLQALREAHAFLKPDEATAVVDLYCGTGSSMQMWLHSGAQVMGVEASPDAVRLAALNVPTAEVLAGTCRQRLPQLEAWRTKKQLEGMQLLVYANPPRMGIEPEVLMWMCNTAKPLRMAYLSCSPGTLARDLSTLSQHSFRISQLIPFDFFPQTHHVETLALIERA